MTKQTETPLTERKVVRRGLMAGLAGLGAAALLKVNGAGKAEAADGDPIKAGALVVASTRTTLLVSPQTADAALSIEHGASGFVSPGREGLRVYVGGFAGAGSTGIRAVTVDSGGDQTIGVKGTATSGLGGIGVWGSGSALYGVLGDVTESAGIGVKGLNMNNGTGIKGLSNTGGSLVADGNGSGIGVHGKSGSGTGVRGDSASGPGVHGQSVSSLGVRGVSTNFVGVVGISTGSHGLYGATSALGAAGLVGENTAGGLAGVFNGNVQVFGALQVFGAKNAIIKMPDGTNASVYCQESPEAWFEDFGAARLSVGVAQVALEREFASLIAGGEYLVFLTPEGDTRGIFVSRKSASGFEVREVQGGTGSPAFNYRIVTKRKDIEGRRFARVSDDGAKSVAAVRAALGINGGAPSPNPPSQPAPTFVPPVTTVPPVSPPPVTPPGPADGNRPRTER